MENNRVELTISGKGQFTHCTRVMDAESAVIITIDKKGQTSEGVRFNSSVAICGNFAEDPENNKGEIDIMKVRALGKQCARAAYKLCENELNAPMIIGEFEDVLAEELHRIYRELMEAEKKKVKETLKLSEEEAVQFFGKIDDITSELTEILKRAGGNDETEKRKL